MIATKKTKLSSKIRIRPIMIVSLAILLAGGGYLYWRGISQKKANTANVSLLQTAKAIVGNLVLFASGTGTIQPASESNLSFTASGQVSGINVKIGDQVKTGQVLAQLDDTDAKIKLAEAQEAMNKLTSSAAIATATQTLAQAETDFATAKSALEYLISPEVLYWQEQVEARGQTLTDAQTAAQTESSDSAKQKVTEAQTALSYAQNQLKYFQTV